MGTLRAVDLFLVRDVERHFVQCLTDSYNATFQSDLFHDTILTSGLVNGAAGSRDLPEPCYRFRMSPPKIGANIDASLYCRASHLLWSLQIIISTGPGPAGAIARDLRDGSALEQQS